MQPLSLRDRALVERLTRAPAGPWDRAWAGLRRRRALAELGHTRDLAVVPHLAPFVLDDTPLADVAAHALGRILRNHPTSDWLALEQLRRHLRGSWSSLRPSDISRLTRLRAAWAALGLASLHPDGHVRRAATDALARHTGEGAPGLPFLLLRLNDWAEPVRLAARNAIAAHLRSSHASAWVRSLPLLERLVDRTRVDHRPLLAAVTALLGAPTALPALIGGALDPDLAVGLPSLRLALALATTDRSLFHHCILHADPRVRRAIAEHLHRLPDTRRDDELLLLALAHRDAHLRRHAFAALADQPLREHALLTRLLADRRACNRRFARFALGQLDPAFDVLAWYRRALSTTRDPLVLGAIIQGYGECDVTDPGPLVPYTTHANNRVKAAANIATTMIERQRATATGRSSGSS